MSNKKCKMCPRECNIDRSTVLGFCSASDKVKIARASRHMWEEPCISGEQGSGTVFFSGCNLKCVYCQNEAISRSNIGKELSIDELRNLFLKISKSGVHNINLVTPTHYLKQIIEAIKPIKNDITVPVVYNCSGYESIGMIKECQGIIDIFLTDMKYKSKELSEKYSSCRNYFEIAVPVLGEMINATGLPIIEEGIMKSGVIVRHLVLPSCKNDSIDILSSLYNEFGNKSFLVSLMSQFTPNENCKNYPEINRCITKLEYQRVSEVFEKLGFQGYMQEKSSAVRSYTPDFGDLGEFLQ